MHIPSDPRSGYEGNLGTRTLLLASAPFFPAFLQHFGVLQGCLYSTKRNSFKKTLESLFGLC